MKTNAILFSLAVTAGLSSRPAQATPQQCEDRSASYRELLSRFSAGSDRVELGRFSGQLEVRDCHPITGCSDFVLRDTDSMSLWLDGTSPYYYHTGFATSLDGTASLFVQDDGDLLLILSTDQVPGNVTTYSTHTVCTMSPQDTGFQSCWTRTVSRPTGEPYPSAVGLTPSFPAPSCNVYGCYSGSHALRIDPATIRVSAGCMSFSTHGTADSHATVPLRRWSALATLER
jgi:hypothetical protein